MPHHLMLRCEQRREYLISGKHEWRWKEVPVAEAADAGPAARIDRIVNCLQCTDEIPNSHTVSFNWGSDDERFDPRLAGKVR